MAFDGDAPAGAEVPVLAPAAPPAGAPRRARGGRRRGRPRAAAPRGVGPVRRGRRTGGAGRQARGQGRLGALRGDHAKEERPAAAPAGAPAPPPLEVAGTVGQYPGDDAGQPAIAAWMAAEAKARGIPPELPVMAGLVESGLRNLNFGDADSLGFFQMRVSIWNQGEYAGYGDDPQKQIDWFLDQAEAVKAQRISRGLSVDDPNQFGEWIADVERPAEQFRGRYQLRLDEAQRPAAGRTGAVRRRGGRAGRARRRAGAPSPSRPAAPAAPIDPGAVRRRGHGHGRPARRGGAGAAGEQAVILDSVGVADIKAGRIDPRIVAVLTKLSKEHTITVSCMCSDHSKFTVGGSVSNHHFGRGLDIAAIDGRPVNASNFEAREMALELQELAPSIRPDEIGSPFPIAGPGYFTDSGHQDHLHVGFKQAITPDFKLPPDLAAPAPRRTWAPRVAEAPRRRGHRGSSPPSRSRAPRGRPPPPTPARRTPAAPGCSRRSPRAGRAERRAAGPAAPVAGSPAGAFPVTPSPAGGQAADVLAPPNLTQGAGPQARAALAEARKYLGTPVPLGRLDAGDRVRLLGARAVGVRAGRASRSRASRTTRSRRATAARYGGASSCPGDLVFFRDPSGYVHHVGMSLGGDRFIHAPRTGDVVKESSLDEPYYRQQFAGGRRFGAAAPCAPARAAGGVGAAGAWRRGGAAPPTRPSIRPRSPTRGPPRRGTPSWRASRAAACSAPSPPRRRATTARRRPRRRTASAAAASSPPSPPRRSRIARPTRRRSPPSRPRRPPRRARPSPRAPGAPPDLSAVPVDYPGNDASQEELARWLAREAQKAGLPAELPVMAALVESGVRNLSFGDADSVGFFQMRVSIWNRGAYAGYPQNPGLQIKWFIDQALALKRKRIAQGYENFGSDPATWGAWIADVERPAEQFRGRYQLRLAEARRLLR